MADFSERYENHPIHGEINRVCELIAKHRLSFEREQVDERSAYARFLRSIRHIKWRVENVDPELVTISALDAVHKRLHSLADHFDVFAVEKNWDQLANQTDVALDQLHRLPYSGSVPTLPEFSDVLVTFRKEADKQLDQIIERSEKETNRFNQYFEKTSRQIEDFKSRLEQYNQQLSEEKTRLDKLVLDETTRFTESEKQRADNYQEAEAKRKGDIESFLSSKSDSWTELKRNALNELAELSESYTKTSGEMMSELEAKREEARSIVGLIGSTGMTGHYQKVANSNQSSANWLRRVAIIFFILVVAAVAWVLHGANDSEFSWEMGLFRIAVTITLLAPALYCARESTRHRTAEQINRRIELELASIEPYLYKIDPGRAQQIKEELAMKYFGNHSNMQSPKDLDSFLETRSLSTDQLVRIIELALKKG